MSSDFNPATRLIAGPRSLNLFYLHELFQYIADRVTTTTRDKLGFEIPLTAGMWGGSYLVANDLGVSRTNVIRLYSLVSLPQNTPLDEPENFEKFMEIYRDTLQESFRPSGLDLVKPTWGENIPYSNRQKPTTAMQLVDATQRVNFVRAFFVWNSAPWSEAVVYDMIRNVRQLKELLDANRRPLKRAVDEMKFMLQDVMITYFTLQTALHPDFVEHAEPIISELFDHFIKGLYDPEVIEEQYHKVYSQMLVYGYEEALELPYKKDGLDIFNIEDWPVEKINYVPQELKDKLTPHLEGTFENYRRNLAAQSS